MSRLIPWRATAAAGPLASPPTRAALYGVLNVAFLIFMAAAAGLGGAADPRIPYLCLLFALCSSTLLFVSRANGPHAILAILLAFYFFSYAFSDVIGLLSPALARAPENSGLLSPTEVAVLLGAALLIAGYQAGVVITRGARNTLLAQDWPDRTLIVVGLALWALGVAATWLWASEVVDRYIAGTRLSPVQAIAVTIARYAQPVGVALIAYKFVLSRGFLLSALILGMLSAEFVLGFIADSKELSIRGAALVIVASYFLHGKVPKKWFVTAGLVLIVALPVFHAYRFEVLQEGKQTRTEGVQNLGKNLTTALQSDISTGGGVGRANTALGRLSLKPTLEMILARVGKDVAYQDGHTLGLFFAGFVPRIFWPTKPDTSVGQLFNRQFGVSADPDTYISATQLGELYWNFGWSGIVVGMPLIGFLLGWVGARFCLADRKSMTRFLMLAITVYLVCLRFEAGIAITYTQWIRSVALVLLLHFVFARSSGAAPQVAAVDVQAGGAASGNEPRPPVAHPNLMR